jgi:hypothetical protein
MAVQKLLFGGSFQPETRENVPNLRTSTVYITDLDELELA